MGKFLLGLIVALLIGTGVYYLMLRDAADAPQDEGRPVQGADLDLQAAPRIPEGAVMEDGTLD